MFDFGWSEIIVIGAIALVVIGPEDLPKFLRTAGQVTRRARQLANEFQNSIDDMVRESEIEEVKKKLQLEAMEAEKTIGQALDLPHDLSGEGGLHGISETIPPFDPLSDPVVSNPEPDPQATAASAPPSPRVDGRGLDTDAILAAAEASSPDHTPPDHPSHPIAPTRTPPAP